MVATWSDSDASNDDSYDDEVVNLCFMALDDSKVIFKETHFKNFFAKSNDSHEASSKCAYCKKLGHSIQYCCLKIVTFRGKFVKSVWISKGISTSQNEITKMKWIPKSSKIVSTYTQGPKKIWVPKAKT